MDDITAQLMQQLISLCTECGIEDIIDMESLDCVSESVVAYRARLEGTSQRDSGYLISLIEDWVKHGAIIIVTGITMTVESQCSSISSSECSQITTTSSTTFDTITTSDRTSSTSSQASSDTPAIIGGVVAIIIALIIGVVFIVALAIIVRARLTSDDRVITETEER